MVTTERELSSHITKRENNEDNNSFQNNFYQALQLDLIQRNGDKSANKVNFSEQITQKFPENFFTEENEVTAAAIITENLLSNWPEEVPLNQFREGEECVKIFCVEAIPLLQESYPHLNPDQVGHHLITSTLMAHSKLREAYGITPIPNSERVRMHLDISKALEDADEPISQVSKANKIEIPIFVRS